MLFVAPLILSIIVCGFKNVSLSAIKSFHQALTKRDKTRCGILRSISLEFKNACVRFIFLYEFLVHKFNYTIAKQSYTWLNSMQLKVTDGALFLGPVVIMISLLFMNGAETGEKAVIQQTIQTNATAMMVSALGVVLLSIAIAGHFSSLNAGLFLLLEGTGLFSAILGFFFYGSAMIWESTGLILSQPQFYIGLLIWATGIFLIAFAGVNVRKREEIVVFSNAVITLVLACYFVWEIVLKYLH